MGDYDDPDLGGFGGWGEIGAGPYLTNLSGPAPIL